MATDPDRKADAAGDAPPDAKLTVKVGDHEIHLEASPDVVRQELGRVLDRLFQTPGGDRRDPGEEAVVSLTVPRPAAPKPASGPAPPAAPSVVETVIRARGRQMLQPGAVSLLRHVSLDPERLGALYSVDPEGQVYLQAPARTGDRLENTLLLLLYGALALRGVAAVPGGFLLRGARSLGFKLARVPRDFGDGKLAEVQGRHRRKTYRLSAEGVRHCETLIPGLLRSVDG
jgi:hypothetical protein